MTIALGATFPLAIAMTSAAGEAAAAAAVIYATNTAGAIAGALAGSFILIPQLGLQRSLQLASIAAVLAGVFVAWRSAAGLPGPKRRPPLPTCGVDRGHQCRRLRASDAAMEPRPPGERRVPVRAIARRRRHRDGAGSRRSFLLSRGRGGHRVGPAADRRDLAGDRRQGGCVERLRYG